jgi:tyrosinase
MTRTRRDVWNLTDAEGEWPEVLLAYEKAVVLLRAGDTGPGRPTHPLGWRFIAAMHGLAGPNGRPDTSNPLWCMCQHGSWFFFPWHRMYLRAFELIVQDVLQDADWSLPYWYSVDPDNRATSILPPAFRDTTKQLFVQQRSSPANGGAPLPDFSNSLLQALEADDFSTPAGTSTFGGGERADPSFNAPEVGLLEGAPHGGVHVFVGDDFDANGDPIRQGWMGHPYTAAQDPIFWLHHANIDRLWQVWLDLDPAHREPTGDLAWMDTEFSFPRVGGGVHTWKVADVLDTESLGYNYESTAPPSAVAPAPVAGGPETGLAEAIVPEARRPQVIGATRDVPLASREAVDVELAAPDFGPEGGEEAAETSGRPSRVFLRIEGVTGSRAAPVYEVYLNVPPEEEPTEHPELRAGYFSTFGMVEASERNELHDGSGVSAVFDVTRIRDMLEEQDRWDPNHVQVSFSPVIPVPPAGEAVPVAAAEAPADLRASQVSVVVT